MINRYYLQELAALRDLGREFAETNPAIASMLSGPTTDPDVERLLEGVAFLTALIREKLDDDFPEIVHDLVQLIWPHYLRPIPATTIVAFTPKPSLKQSLSIEAGVQLASVPIAGTTCLFRTSQKVELHPLELVHAEYQERPGKSPAIVLSFELKGISLKNWKITRLRLHLAGVYADAVDRYHLLRRYVQAITLKEQDDNRVFTLSPDNLLPLGFALQEGTIPYPGNSFPAYRLLQEYFTMPSNFLFLDLIGWEKWQKKGDGKRFELAFELKNLPFAPPRIRAQDFVLFATPAINLFPHEADPIRLDHRRTEYRITPAGSNGDNFQIYSVDNVIGYQQGSATSRQYKHFDQFNRERATDAVYNVVQKRSPSKRRTDIYLSVAYPPESGPPLPETLSVNVSCTNGTLPERLAVGDIVIPTSSTPELVDFVNITKPSAEILPPLGANLLWRLLAHLSLNYLSITDTKNFKALLGLYLFPENQERNILIANQKRIDGIETIETTGIDRLVRGLPLRGRAITCKISQDHFACLGDWYLFGAVLNEFFAVYASLNSFTRFTLQETLTGDYIVWPAKIGERSLM